MIQQGVGATNDDVAPVHLKEWGESVLLRPPETNELSARVQLEACLCYRQHLELKLTGRGALLVRHGAQRGQRFLVHYRPVLAIELHLKQVVERRSPLMHAVSPGRVKDHCAGDWSEAIGRSTFRGKGGRGKFLRQFRLLIYRDHNARQGWVVESPGQVAVRGHSNLVGKGWVGSVWVWIVTLGPPNKARCVR